MAPIQSNDLVSLWAKGVPVSGKLAGKGHDNVENRAGYN